ncbi:MAG: ABC transporter permease [Deltaproteobacteria bacterium]|nr:ABC transporter permease [Deltaproteobacteria bacterium]
MIRFLPLVARNLGRNPLRTALTGGAILLAIALVCVLRTMPAAFDAILSRLSNNTRVSIHHSAGIVYSMPYAYLNKVRSIPGVVDAVSWTWFGGAIDPDEGVTFPNFAVDAEHVATVYEDYALDPAEVADFERTRTGALVGQRAMTDNGWKVGDLVTLKSTIYPLELEFRIAGTVPGASLRTSSESTNLPVFWFHREYLVEALREQGIEFDVLGNIWARVDDPAKVPAIMAQVDEMFRNSEAETVSETEKSFFTSFFSQVQGLLVVIQAVALLVTLCIVFIAANTASMTVRERMREIAVLRAIGFGRNLLFGTLLAEAALLSTAAGTAGVFASLGLAKWLAAMGTANPAMGPLTAFVVTNAVLVQGIFLAFLIGIVTGAIPAFGASRRSVALTLREIF